MPVCLLTASLVSWNNRNAVGVLLAFVSYWFLLMQVLCICLTWNQTQIGQSHLLWLVCAVCELLVEEGVVPLEKLVIEVHALWNNWAIRLQIGADLFKFDQSVY